MKTIISVLMVIAILVSVNSMTFAGNCKGPKSGVCAPNPDCPNPDAPDDDGDGIPNGQDDDYQPPKDGRGK